MKSYHCSLLRYRHHKAAGEFANIGVLMLATGEPQVYWFVTRQHQRLARFFADFEVSAYRELVGKLRDQFEAVVSEWQPTASHDEAELGNASTLGKLRQMLVPDDETCFLWSGVMSGVHPAPQVRFEELCHEFIVRHEESAP